MENAMTNLRIEYTEITPEIAAEMLRKNVANNRSLMATTVAKYANLMSKGQWDTQTGDTIKISKDGFVIDGQHRLHAVVKSGITIHSFIAYGLDVESFRNIDVGQSRKLSDALHFAEIPTSKVVASAIQLYWNLKSGVYMGVMRSPETPQRGTGGSMSYVSKGATSLRLSALDIEKIYFENEAKWYRYINTYLKKCRVIDTSSNIAGMWAYLADINEQDAKEFISRLIEGDGLEFGSPILALRNRLLAAKSTKAGFLSSAERRAVYVSAWNAFRKGKNQNSVRITDLSIMPI